MTDKIRKGLGGLCVGTAISMLGAALLAYGLTAFGGIVLFVAMLVAIASLLTLAADLLR